MKLLLDENLSDRIINKIVDLYPDSSHVKTLDLTNTDDALIWEYAKANGFASFLKILTFINAVCSTVIRPSLFICVLATVQHQKLFRF